MRKTGTPRPMPNIRIAIGIQAMALIGRSISTIGSTIALDKQEARREQREREPGGDPEP